MHVLTVMSDVQSGYQNTQTLRWRSATQLRDVRMGGLVEEALVGVTRPLLLALSG